MTLQQLAPLAPYLVWGAIGCCALLGGIVGVLAVETILSHSRPHSPKGTPPA